MGMNLIEKLGLEKCKAIVDGAPNAKYFGCSIETAKYWVNQSNEYHSNPVFFPNMSRQVAYVLDDLRTAIADHECDHNWEDISCNGDLERQLICTYCSMKKSVPFGLNAKRWLEEDTDHCSDIRNHISPNTKVIER